MSLGTPKLTLKYWRFSCYSVILQTQLCQIGYPWQYKQPYFFKPKLWTANFLLRTFFLNKILPKIFGQQVCDITSSPPFPSSSLQARVLCFACVWFLHLVGVVIGRSAHCA